MQPSAAHRRVGFVGLGNLGLPIARRLADADHLHAVWSRSAMRASTLPAAVDQATSLAELAADIDVLCVCVPDEVAVDDVVHGALSTLRSGSIIVVHSTVRPDACGELAATASELGVRVLDAPVCGGPQAAAAGELLVAVGGDSGAVERVAHLFEDIALLWRHVGSVGAGQYVKLVMNLLYAANVELICQALEAGEALRLPRDVLGEFIRTLPTPGFVGSFLATGVPGPDLVEHGRLLIAKDVRYAESLLDAHEVDAKTLLDLGQAAVESLRATTTGLRPGDNETVT